MSNFEEIFGVSWKDMDEGEYKVAVQSTLHGIMERLDKIKGCVQDTVKCTEKHKTYFKALWWIVGVVSVALTGVLIDLIFRGGAH